MLETVFGAVRRIVSFNAIIIDDCFGIPYQVPGSMGSPSVGALGLGRTASKQPRK